MEYYTFDELRALGCPNELLMQYICLSKQDIDNMLKTSQNSPIEDK